jgi:hypothetical protein
MSMRIRRKEKYALYAGESLMAIYSAFQQQQGEYELMV